MQSTSRDDGVNGAHSMDAPMDNTADGSTPRIHWSTSMKPRCLVSCVFPTWFVLHVLIKFEYFTDEKFQSLGVLCVLCHPSRNNLDRWHSTQSTLRIRIFIPLFYVYILYAFIMWINIFQIFWKLSGSAPNVIIMFKIFCRPRTHWWMTLQTKHTKDAPMDDTADGAHQRSTDRWSCIVLWVACFLIYLICAAWLNQIQIFYSFRVLEQQGSTSMLRTEHTKDPLKD